MPEVDDDDLREVIEGYYRVLYRIRSDVLLEVITVFDGRQEASRTTTSSMESDQPRAARELNRLEDCPLRR